MTSKKFSISTEFQTHIIPIGFEFDRVIEPLIFMKANRAIFLLHKEKSTGQQYLDRILQEIRDKNIIKAEEIEISTCDYFDWWDCLEKISGIYRNELKKGNKLYINVSSGSKIVGMAGFHASLIGNITPYYAIMKDYHPVCDKDTYTPISEGVADIIKLPKIQIQKPEKPWIHFLKLFADRLKAQKMKFLIKKQCVDFLYEIAPELEPDHRIRAERAQREVPTQTYGLLNKLFISPLINLGFLKELPIGRGKLEITAEGHRNLAIYQNFYDL